jgi:hypothetical protein
VREIIYVGYRYNNNNRLIKMDDDCYASANHTYPFGHGKDNTGNNLSNKYDSVTSEELSNPYDVKEDHYTKIAMRTKKETPSAVAKEFFSVTNIKRIQKKIKREIYNRSYGKFKLEEDQKVLDLLIVMMEINRLYGKDLPFSVTRQVKVLNEQTVQYLAPDMMTNIKQHYGYLDDITNPVNMMPDPINCNRNGRKLISGTAQLYGI